MNLVTPICDVNKTTKYEMLKRADMTNVPKVDELDTFIPSSLAFKASCGVKQNKGLLAWLLATMAAFFGTKSVRAEELDEYKASKLNPELTESLRKIMYKHGRDGDNEDPALNYRMVLRIVEQNEQNPITAVALKDFLNHDSSPNYVSNEQVDFMVTKFLEDPEHAKALKQCTPNATATILMLDAEDPEFARTVLDENIYYKNAEKLFNIGEKDKELRDKLLNSELDFTQTYFVEDNVIDNFKELETQINGVLKLCKELKIDQHQINILDWAKEYDKFIDPKNFEAIIKKYEIGAFDFEHLKELISMRNIEPVVEQYMHDSYKLNHRSLRDENNPLAIIQKNAPVISRIVANVKEPKDRVNLIDKIVTELSEELDKTMPRIIADGRLNMINSFEDLKELSSLYNRYPDIKITDRMIQLNKDPKLNIFDISRM